MTRREGERAQRAGRALVLAAGGLAGCAYVYTEQQAALQQTEQRLETGEGAVEAAETELAGLRSRIDMASAELVATGQKLADLREQRNRLDDAVPAGEASLSAASVTLSLYRGWHCTGAGRIIPVPRPAGYWEGEYFVSLPSLSAGTWQTERCSNPRGMIPMRTLIVRSFRLGLGLMFLAPLLAVAATEDFTYDAGTTTRFPLPFPSGSVATTFTSYTGTAFPFAMGTFEVGTTGDFSIAVSGIGSGVGVFVAEGPFAPNDVADPVTPLANFLAGTQAPPTIRLQAGDKKA